MFIFLCTSTHTHSSPSFFTSQRTVLERQQNPRTRFTKPSTSTSTRDPGPSTPQTPISPPSIQEETFWNTPGAGARTLHFKGDSLLDEKVDFGLGAGLGLGGPLDFVVSPGIGLSPAMGPAAGSSFGRGAEPQVLGEEEEEEEEGGAQDDTVLLGTAPVVEDGLTQGENEDEAEADGEEDEDATIMLGKPSAPPHALVPSQDEYDTGNTPARPSEDSTPSEPETPSASNASKRAKVKVTPELERAVVRPFFLFPCVGRVLTALADLGEDMGNDR